MLHPSRIYLFVVVLFATAPLLAQQPAYARVPLDIRTDVLPSPVPQEVMLVEHDFDPGKSSQWHIHHGVELAYVLAGTFEVRVQGQPTRTYSAGESFRVARDTPHEAVNVTQGTARLIISYLMDKGVPWKILVEPPSPNKP